jgi:hypothetical protein
MGGKFRAAMSKKAGKDLTMEEAKDFKAKMDSAKEKKEKIISTLKIKISDVKAELETAKSSHEKAVGNQVLIESDENATEDQVNEINHAVLEAEKVVTAVSKELEKHEKALEEETAE